MKTYAGTFIIAFATLALEISLTRLMSVVTWYHLAFFAISTAMLGMTAAAVSVYVRRPPADLAELDRRLQTACVAFGVSVPVSLFILTRVSFGIGTLNEMVTGLLVFTLACALPFYFSGSALALVLTRHPLPVSRIYASDLAGASLGCLFVLGGLEVLDVPTLILLCGVVGLVGGLFFGAGSTPRTSRALAWAVGALLAVGVWANATAPVGMDPTIVKGRPMNPEHQTVDRWNSFSRVVVYLGGERPPFYWGASAQAPTAPVWQAFMNIDGEAGTTLVQFDSLEAGAYLRFDVTNMAYYVRPRGGAAVIGVGGGRDVQAALVFGHEKVTGIEVNPIFVDLLTDEFRDVARLAGRDDVHLVVDDARSYLSRVDDRFAVIQMSMIDTWAATGAGAFSHTEAGLYTVEAWSVFLDRLTDDGILTVSRWHNPAELGETARVLSLGVAALLEKGVEDPARHLALITTARLSTLIVSRRPLTDEDLERLQTASDDLGFTPTVLPGMDPAHPLLRGVVGAKSRDELLRVAEGAALDITPPTDESPYFFNMLRLRDAVGSTGALVRSRDRIPSGVLGGNLLATGVLAGLILSLMVLAALTIVVPLLLRKPLRETHIHWSGALYFSLIGAGFMSVEIGLIQKLSLFLGHPVYALGILLFSVILSTGVGSYVSEWLPLTGRTGKLVFPLATAAVVLGLAVIFPFIAREMAAAERLPRILVSVSLIVPLGVMLGFFFPTGMKLLEQDASAETPWYWALNGIFGLLFASLAVFVAIYFGISANFYIAAACYAATALVLRRMETIA